MSKAGAVFRKYSFGKDYWGKTFLAEPEDKVWELAKNRFETKDVRVFQEMVQKFSPRFEKLWPEERVLLEKWADKLGQTQDKMSPPELIEDLNIFFGSKVKISQPIKIVLLMGVAGNFPNGGGSLHQGQVTLEISRIPLEYIRPAWLIIWHELVHNLWQDETYHLQVERVIKVAQKAGVTFPIKGRPLSVVVNEAVAQSLLHVGYLAKKHFGFPVEEYFRKMLVQGRWSDRLAFGLMKLSGRYIEGRRQIDKAYLDQVVEVVRSL